MLGYWLMPVYVFITVNPLRGRIIAVVTQAPVMNNEYCLPLNLLHWLCGIIGEKLHVSNNNDAVVK